MISEKSITTASEDQLNYMKIVNHLYNLVLKVTENEYGSVIAIIGDWGIGKTSILNLLAEKINNENENKNTEANKKIKVFKLDVVDYSKFRYIVMEIISIMYESFEIYKAENLKKVFSRFATFTTTVLDIFSKVPMEGEGFILQLFPVFRSILRSAKEGIEDISEYDEKSLSSIKSKLKEQLKEKQEKLVLIIDDVDRMDNEEFMSILKLLREFSELPNVTFIITLTEESIKYKNTKYIEKYIEIPFFIPYVDLEKFLKTKISEYINTLDFIEVEESEISFVVTTLLLLYIRTPRDVNRLINTLYIERELYKNIYPIDLILLTAIKIFDFNSYSLIRNWVIYDDSDERKLQQLQKKQELSENSRKVLDLLNNKKRFAHLNDIKNEMFYNKSTRKRYFSLLNFS